MKTAIVIFTCNAVSRGVWDKVLDAIDRQDFKADERIVVDSASDDRTVPMALERDWQVMHILREDFDYGLSRNRILRHLQERGFDAAVFLSQDAILASPDALGRIVGFLRDHPVAGCYGRQLDTRRHSLGGWQRELCYPEISQVKTLADAPRLKMLTPFCSNAFAAWKIAEVLERGGFPSVMFGEDTLFAAKVIEDGGAIGYCAESAVVHEHPENVSSLFLRGRAVGEFHRHYPELLRRFGAPEWPPLGEGFCFILPKFLVKLFGYVWGRFLERLIP